MLKIIVFIFVVIFSFVGIVKADEAPDSSKQIAYKQFQALLDHQVVNKYLTRADLEKLLEKDQALLNSLYIYFYKSYELIDDPEYKGLKVAKSSIDIVELEYLRSKNKRKTYKEAVPGYILVIYAEEELKIKIPEKIKEYSERRIKSKKAKGEKKS